MCINMVLSIGSLTRYIEKQQQYKHPYMAVACGGNGCMRTIDAVVDKNQSGENQNVIALCA